MNSFKIFDDYKKLENLRCAIYNIDFKNEYLLDCLKNNKMVGIGVYVNDELIGGCYISDLMNTLYIEQLFIKPEFQHKGYGTNTIKYIHENKVFFEGVFDKKFRTSKLEPNSKESEKFYQKLGYIKSEDLLDTMKKII